MSQSKSGSPQGVTRAAIRVVAALIAEGGRYLITQRRSNAALPLLWEFPGGRVELDETDAAALERELAHRLGVQVEVGTLLSFVSHPYERYTVDLHLYACRVTSGEPAVCHVHAYRWVTSEELDQYAFTPADERSMSQLLGLDPP